MNMENYSMQNADSDSHVTDGEGRARSMITHSPVPESSQLYQQSPSTPMASRSRPLLNSSPPGEHHGPSFRGRSPGAVMAPPQSGMSNLGKRRHQDFAKGYSPSSPAERASKRATPDPSFNAAPALTRRSSDSSLSIDIDDGTAEALASIIGYDPRQDKRRFKEEQKNAFEELAAPVTKDDTQVLADEELARRLQEEWNDDLPIANESFQPAPKAQPVSHEQSYLDRFGQIRPLARQIPDIPVLPSLEIPSFPPKLSSPRNDFNSSNDQRYAVPGAFPQDGRLHGMAQPLTKPMAYKAKGLQPADESDDDLQIIDGSNFKPSNRQANAPYLRAGDRMYADPPSRPPAQQFGVPGLLNAVQSRNPSLRYTPGVVHPTTTMGRYDSQSSASGHVGPGNFGGNFSGSFGGNLGGNSLPSFQGLPGIAGSFGDFQPSDGQDPFRSSLSSTGVKSQMGWGNDDTDEDGDGFANRFDPYNPYHNLPPYANYGYGDHVTTSENAEALKDLLAEIQPDEEPNLGAGEEERDNTPAGMADTATLYKYQQKGLAWLIKKEEGSNKGSILADDMGLGKTIQTIALMVSRQSESPQLKTNLIIAPVALVRQWESELRNKIRPSHRLSVLIHHGASKGSNTWEKLRQHDVVISTYGTLTADHKKKQQLEKRMKDNPQLRPCAEEMPVLTGDNCKFFRCILDEGQNIKNKNAKAALAAQEVHASYRLILTGTPLMNNVTELFSLIHFLRIQPYCQWEKFQIDFARPLKSYHSNREVAMRKLQTLCKAIMLRRTKKSEMDGKPLIILPDRKTEQSHAVFDEDERAFYDALEAKSQLTFNKFLKAGTVGRNYSNMLTLLLRLRQACCHPHLIRDFAIAVDASPEQLLENARALPDSVVDRIIENAIADCPVCMDTADNYTIFNPCGHSTCPECFCSLSDTTQNPNATQSEAGGKAKFACHACRTEVDPTKVTDYDYFKRVHEPEKAALEGLPDVEDSSDDSDTSSDTETEASDGVASLKDFVVDDDASVDHDKDGSDSDDDLDNTKPVEPSRTRKSRTKQEAVRPKSQVSPSSSDRLFSPKQEDDDSDDDLDILSHATQTTGGNVQKTEGHEAVPNPSTKGKTKAHVGEEKLSKDEDKTRRHGYSNGSNPFEKAKGRKQKRSKKDKKTRKEKSRKTARKTLAQLKKESLRNIASRKEYFRRLTKDFIPSAKITKCMEILQDVLSAPEGEKVIVFSQFTSLLDLVEIPMHRAGWQYRRFDGSMNAVNRNQSIVEFTSNPRVRVLLVSLKAGNAGLNLTAASQVIILDPFWNPYIEEQAIDRAHRIGQRRTVQVHRILVPETVEDRILQLQDKKRELIEGALDERASNNIGRLGVKELGFLFGIRS